MASLAHPPAGGMSGIRESDPLLCLGKAAYYRCTNPAIINLVTRFSPPSAGRSTPELPPQLAS